MAVFTIADLHLSLGTDKPMDVFGGGWEGYVDKLEKNWRELITPDDTVVIPGDISWAMRLEEVEPDFTFLESLPGKKILGKGNHDYWWTSLSKMKSFISAKGFSSISFLYNNAFACDNIIICGSRGWMIDGTESFDKKIQEREAGRLKMSLTQGEKLCKSGQKPTVFLHYPPVWRGNVCEPIMETLKEHGITDVYYGHLHGVKKDSVTTLYEGIKMTIVSADFIKFRPISVE